MRFEIIIAVIVLLVGLRWLKPGMLAWVAAWWVGLYALIRFGFSVPVPASVVQLYMGIVSLALLAYVLSDAERQRQVKEPLVRTMTERKSLPLLALVVLAIPIAVAANIYFDMTSDPVPPAFARTVHPAPPDEISAWDKSYDLITLGNPYRSLESSDPAAFAAHVESGREVYYERCYYCHGDVLYGEGMFAHGLNPLPTNFQDQGTLPILQESFLFWRIVKGAPGLPEEGGPWASAMPAWESDLSEDDVWNVILFLYDFIDRRPRARHEVDH